MGSDVNWRIEPTSGQLSPGQEVAVMVYFSPIAPQSYSYPIDIFLDAPPGVNSNISNESLKESPQVLTLTGAGSSSLPPVGETLSSLLPNTFPSQTKPYTSVLLTGVGTTPRLIFDCDEVLLPTVPLGIKSTATFHIRNEGYENLELKWDIPMDTVRAPITLRLPSGSTLGTSHPILPVEVTFLAKKPVSFTMMVYFIDSDGNRFGIRLTGTSDNSICTVQNYIESHPGGWEINVTHVPLLTSGSSQLMIASSGQQSTTSNGTNKIFTLVETTGKSGQRFAFDRESKAIYSGIDMSQSNPSRLRGYDFDDDDRHSGVGSDASGVGHDLTPMHDIDGMFTGLDFGSPGGSISRPFDGERRLTPVKMLGQASLAGGEGLFTHTLDSVLAYLHASKLLTGGSFDEELNDSPPSSPLDHTVIDLSSPSRHRTGKISNSRSSTKQLGATTGSAHAATGTISSSSKSPTRLTITAHSFPNDLVKSQGKLIRILIKHLTGKSVPTQASKKANQYSRNKEKTVISMETTLTKNVQIPIVGSTGSETPLHSGLGSTQEFHPPNTSSNKSDELIWTIYLDYEELLIFLKSQGCLLGRIQAWHLLSFHQLLRLLNSPTTQTQFTELGHTATMSSSEIQARHRKLEQEFPMLARTAWLTILVQMIKVFILNRITPQSFKQLPGMSPDLPCMSYTYSQSNIYSPAESILLEWLSYHSHRSNPLHPRQVVDFQKSLTDGLVLAGVIQSHIPNITSLMHMRTHITSTEDCVYNAGKIISALKEIGLHYELTSTQLVNAHQRDMLLFVLFLYQKLPHYVPRTTLEFRGTLDDEIVKCIELTNPSTRSITYSVHIEGANDFRVDSYTVQLAGKGKNGSTVKFPVRFKSRFSKPVEARLVFQSNDEIDAGASASSDAALTSATTMVFLLKSHIISRHAIESYQVKTRVYETTAIDVRVKNPFHKECTFQIAVKIDLEPPINTGANSSKNTAHVNPIVPGRPIPISGSANNAPTHRNIGSARSTTSTRSGAAVSIADKLPPSFFVPYERIKLRSGESAVIQVHFLPFRIGHYHAQLVMLDESAGEFMIDFHGTAMPPPPSELFKWTTHMKTSEMKELQFVYKNPGLDLARQSTFERIRALSRQQRDLKKNKSDWANQILRTDILPSTNTGVTYHITSSSPFFQTNGSTMVLYDIKLEKENQKKIPQVKGKGGLPIVVTDLTQSTKEKRSIDPSASSLTQSYLSSISSTNNRSHHDNKLAILFAPRGPGVYRGDIVLTSLYDSRTYSIEATVLADESNPLLEFHVPARQVVTQEIPITNGSNDVWTVKASMTGKGFSGPNELTIFPNTTGGYPLSFAPNWVCDVAGTLVLLNTRTDEKYHYDLHGIGDEPLAESHVLIQAPARSTVQHTVPVKNNSNSDIYYTVECDLPTFDGPTQVRIGAGATYDYAFKLSPSRSGTIFGSLTFHQADKKFQWFSVEVQVTAPEAESEIAVTTPCRRASTISVDITNPVDETLTFEVGLEGIGLFGPKHLTLEPKATSKYEFIYSPLLPVNESEASLSFSSEHVGEWWYKLILTATAPEPESIQFDGVEVGTHKQIEVTLENPTDEEITLNPVSSNQRNFITKPTTITIPPLASSTVQLRYTPSAIGVPQSSTITFKHNLVGDWIYNCSGIGLEPSIMPLTTLNAPVGLKMSRTLSFHNPFEKKMKVDLDLTEKRQSQDDNDNNRATTFQLFMKRTIGIIVAPFSSLQIPLLFAPLTIADHTATLKVSASDLKLTWTYPILGIAEGETSDQPIRLETRAREVHEDVKELKLSGLTKLKADEEFTCQIECTDSSIASKVESSLQVQLLNAPFGSNHIARVGFAFAPRQPWQGRAELIITKQSGGRWKFPLAIQSHLPIPDDTIRIESPVNTTSSVAFRLKNHRQDSTPFTASLTNSSSQQFHVYPKSGSFPSIEDEEYESGTQFVVSFSPIEYGKPLYGELLIQTDDSCHLYQLIGAHPTYSAPIVESQLDTHIDPSFLPHPPDTRRNIVATNIAAASKTPVLAQKVSQTRAWRGSGNTSSAAISAATTGGFKAAK